MVSAKSAPTKASAETLVNRPRHEIRAIGGSVKRPFVRCDLIRETA
jgi:hypothetical protein